ncbi:hypothetical protein H072_9930 [Dactylellina haptotyla CBS 200.50]|uniref:G domain-containing protein n=1 Tax=Dactylellina haptotyla (strain CBS 200.50) TaxID=1284197 RepID=S8A5Y5_DACHA|nr:hypothetical protein H072_9930 [Dactylellina haptotyla CBS 200.50]
MAESHWGPSYPGEMAALDTQGENTLKPGEEKVSSEENLAQDPATTEGDVKPEEQKSPAYSLPSNRSAVSNAPPDILSYRDPTSPVHSGSGREHKFTQRTTERKELPAGAPEFCSGCGAKSHSDDSKQAGFYDPNAEIPQSEHLDGEYVEMSAKWTNLTDVYNASLAQMSDEVKEIMRQSNMLPPSAEEIALEAEYAANDAEPMNTPPLQDQETAEHSYPFDGEVPQSTTPESKSWMQALTPTASERTPQEAGPDRRARAKILCKRCQNLLNYQRKISDTPDATFAQAAQIIAASPFHRVHVYHLVDAADFPMSILPNARRAILRNLKEFPEGRRKDLTMSYVITRADLLMPTEQKLASLMTYMRRVLTSHLGEKEVELKDLRVVSAKRTWTTERLKDEIRARKGGVVLLGKTNVGKSRLYEAVFPKRNAKDFQARKGDFGKRDLREAADDGEEGYMQNGQRVKYPDMPLASKVPGTTVGPIVIDFAAGRGQLVDLPGFNRGGLLEYVAPKHVPSTVLVNKIKPTTRYVVPPGKSFLLGGLVRVKPVQGESGRPITLEIAVFANLPGHTARDDKTEAYMNRQEVDKERDFIWAKPGIGETFKSAGVFTLTDDITKKRSGPMVEKMGEEKFKKYAPFKIYATDIVVEGMGWLEVSAQVGKDDKCPAVEVWSPNGESILQRETMKAYEENLKLGSKAAPGSRPRRSMKGAKKTEKGELRRLRKQVGDMGGAEK